MQLQVVFALAAMLFGCSARPGRAAEGNSMKAPPKNSIMVIRPYWDHGTWVFDDAAAGLTREPFVAGIPEMINTLVKDIPNARNGFRLTFSASPFPGYM